MNQYSSTIALPLNLRKEVLLDFNGGDLSSDSGLLLLNQADAACGLSRMMDSAVRDRRQQSKVTHSLHEMLQCRILAIAAAYPDANDLDTLRHDPIFKMSCGQAPRSGDALASQPTLSRYENGLRRADLMRMGLALARCVIEQLPRDTKHVVIDIDATDDPCHGQQQFEAFNAYYENHCYVPLLVQITDEAGTQWPIGALLRGGRTNPLAGLRALLGRLAPLLRERFPDIAITLRGDSAFGVDRVLRCADRLRIGYVLGLAQNSCLTALGQAAVNRCVAGAARHGDGFRTYGSATYCAGTWDRNRRVVIKVESIRGEANARYVVTNRWHGKSQDLYQFYCGRGDYENRIKELKLDLSSGRTSCHSFLANQGRLLMHLAAFVLWTVVRRAAAGTPWAQMQIGTLRSRLLKVAARIVETTRRVHVHVCASYPQVHIWRQIQQNLSVAGYST